MARTTVTLDDDAAALLRDELEGTRSSFRTVLNRAIRQGLCVEGLGENRPAYRAGPHAFGANPSIDFDQA